ncbi:HEPN domain-containing protein [Nitrospira sp. M1]
MGYSSHFNYADDFINHLDKAFPVTTDPFIKSRYIGFLAVTAVTVYELGLKEIFIDFADRKHKVLGNFTRSYFDRTNGQITRERIVKHYLPMFGEKYVNRFKKRLEVKEAQILREEGKSIKSSYANIIVWRNKFTHEGLISQTVTYDEVKNSYHCGKYILHCLSQTMNR